MDFIRSVECKEHYDVVVAGSGPGGVAAAITLGRLGKKVLLVESSACIGGYATAVMLGIILDMPGKGGIPREIFERLHSMGKAMWTCLWNGRSSRCCHILLVQGKLQQIRGWRESCLHHERTGL